MSNYGECQFAGVEKFKDFLFVKDEHSESIYSFNQTQPVIVKKYIIAKILDQILEGGNWSGLVEHWLNLIDPFISEVGLVGQIVRMDSIQTQSLISQVRIFNFNVGRFLQKIKKK